MKSFRVKKVPASYVDVESGKVVATFKVQVRAFDLIWLTLKTFVDVDEWFAENEAYELKEKLEE